MIQAKINAKALFAFGEGEMDDTLRAELAAQQDVALWHWLRPHNERGALILVDSMLDLAEVGVCLATDNGAQVQAWLASRLVAKPTAEQLESWNNEPSKSFRMLVVSPFVLIQEQDV